MTDLSCPHCMVHFEGQSVTSGLGKDADGHWGMEQITCPKCKRLVVWLNGPVATKRRMVRPHAAHRPVPETVPSTYRQEFGEANETLPVSAAASAALSRRLLQRLLQDEGEIRERNLDREVQAMLDSERLPTDLAEDLDAVRLTGNFAAHPIKSEHTGEIVSVEAGEAEWLLEVLEELLDFFFVRPAKRAAKREAMNAKLEEAGKPPLKTKEP